MKNITYNGETHTLKEWIEILRLSEECCQDDLLDFANELVFDGKITNDNLYKLYVLWSDKPPMMPAVFAKRISIVFKEHRHDLQRFRTSNARGWQKINDNDDV